MPKIKVNDLNLYYEEHGQGEPLIFVSGFIADHTTWQGIIHEYAKNYRVIVFDNRGVGQTEAPDYPYTIEMMADDVAELCRVLNIDTCHLVGNSMGGMIGQILCHKYPHLIKSAVLENTMTKIDIKYALFAEAVLKLMEANIAPETIIKASLGWVFSSRFMQQKGMLEQLIKFQLENPHPLTLTGYKCQLHAALNATTETFIKEIKVPCLVTGSDEDIISSAKETNALAASIANSEYFCFQGGVGHLSHIEKPAEFNRVVLDFLAMQSGK